jgi:hypothetical protein
MSISIRLVRGDTQPPLVFQIFDRATNQPVKLENENMIPMAKFREAGTAATLQTIALTKVPGAEYIGLVRLDWPAGALNVPDGVYEIEVYVLLNHDGTALQSCYNVIRLRVREDFA